MLWSRMKSQLPFSSAISSSRSFMMSSGWAIAVEAPIQAPPSAKAPPTNKERLAITGFPLASHRSTASRYRTARHRPLRRTYRLVARTLSVVVRSRRAAPREVTR